MAYSPTAFQLTHLLQRVYRKLKTARVSKATGGSASTIVDSKLTEFLGDANEDDILNYGTVILVKDSAGLGAAPEGEFSRISDYTASTGTITWADAPTAAPASGDIYMYMTKDFPLADMIEIINDALGSEHIGNRAVNVDTSLTTANDQTEYTLPNAQINDQSILSVEMQTNADDSNDNEYVPINYSITPSGTAGTAGTLVIQQQDSGFKIRLKWVGPHVRVSAYADYVAENIPPAVAEACVVAHALEWYNTKRGGADSFSLQREDRAWNRLEIALAREPIRLPKKLVGGFPHWMPS